MAYIPTVAFIPQPSQRTRDLSKAVVALVAEYRKREPKMSDAEVRQALDLARAAATRTSAADNRMKLLLAVGVSLLFLFGLLALFFFRRF